MRKPPYRILIGLMIFWCSAQVSLYLGHFQISILAMMAVNQTEIPLEKHTALQEDYGPRYSWTKIQEGQLISAYFYGTTIMSLPGGILADYFGPFRTVLAVTFLCAFFTCIAVPLTGENWIPLFICRFLVGCFACVKLPALNGLVARWSPPHEKGTFTSCQLGYVFGTLIIPPCSSFIVQYFGWIWSFYTMAIEATIFAIVWILLVSDFPIENWFCSKEEAEYIELSHGGAMRKGWVKPPFYQMLTSVPLMMTVIGHIGMISGITTCTILLPKFLTEALYFDLSKVGTVAMIPGTARLICGFMFGIIVQILLQRNIDKKYPRKGFVLFSHFLPGMLLFLFLLNHVMTFSDELVISIIVVAYAFASSSVVTTSVNMQDLAPNYAATQNGLMSLFGHFPGFIYPSIVAKVTEEKSGLPEWSIIFAMTGAVYIITGFLFVTFGSTKLQPWNDGPLAQEPDPELSA